MRPKSLLASLALGLAAVLVMPADVLPCGGTSQPNCYRTVWIAKYVRRTVLLPRTGHVDVPIGVLGYANWNLSPPCAQPTAATLTLQLICTPQGGGAAVDVGVQTFSVPAPTTPGAQALGDFTYVIPAGVLKRTVNHVCRVVGVYTVTFGAGVGSGDVVATGDTVVCLVTPAPGNPKVPRLDLQLLLPPAAGDFPRCARGDQATLHFLVVNNDARNAASLTATGAGRQTAVLPNGALAGAAQQNYDNNIYSISNPNPLADTFPAKFAPDVPIGSLLPAGDPSAPSDGAISTTLTIPPLSASIISIKIRSYGKCANGSCNERTLRVEGTFADRSPALACAGTALLVDNVPAKSPLFAVDDFIKVNPGADARFGPAGFIDLSGNTLPHSFTFAAGNLPPSQGVGTHLTGQQVSVVTPTRYPANAMDSVTLDVQPRSSFFDVFLSVDLPPVTTFTDHVVIDGLPTAPTATVQMPFVGLQSRPELDVLYNATSGGLVVTDHASSQVVYTGTLSGYESSPPPGGFVDFQTCRILGTTNRLGAKTIATQPIALTRLFNHRDRTACTSLLDSLRVLDARTGLDADWTATVDGAGLTLPASSGSAPSRLAIETEPVSLSLVGSTNVGWIRVSCPGALADEMVPVATRVVDLPSAPTIARDFTKWRLVAPGTSAPGSVTVKNATRGPLTFEILAPASGPFQLVDPSIVGRHTLAFGASLVVNLTYAPAAIASTDPKRGTQIGTLPILVCSRATNPVTTVRLVGSYAAP